MCAFIKRILRKQIPNNMWRVILITKSNASVFKLTARRILITFSSHSKHIITLSLIIHKPRTKICQLLLMQTI